MVVVVVGDGMEEGREGGVRIRDMGGYWEGWIDSSVAESSLGRR